MLNVQLTYERDGGLYPVLTKFGFDFHTDHYQKKLNSDSFLVKAVNRSESNVLELYCKDEVSFDGCKEFHHLIVHLAKALEASINDEEAMLGYDSLGNPAHLVTNFQSWSHFLDQAKHRSMEGYTVEVYDGKRLLGRGIMVQADLATGDEQPVTKTPYCTIISAEGEETFLGDHLKIIPVVE
ncbi:hypothetical protein CR194_10205 [Salipaludibacillus keqinensis]|uniref:Uncharacterized protein n=1 Tax=Salipaludibacillus keqinensis TaxID=2045207 RepID=A0A323TDN4_9BACI|nr:hypothetical protein [Salipaludibacillus keqinensis]PYZ93532.1 hypothetical protein CR194_10205 [Salipaludibacillus keqinensis]